MELLGEQGIDVFKVNTKKTATPPQENRNKRPGLRCAEHLPEPPGFSPGDSAHAQRRRGRDCFPTRVRFQLV